VRDSFGARVEQLDFTDGAKAARKINDFVQRITHDKIKDLISPGKSLLKVFQIGHWLRFA
jgi:serine protease inhibitor